MGEPVRIDDVARKMIRLAGCTIKGPDNPDGDVAIEYTGLRPGEKLHEELVIGNSIERTAIPRSCAPRRIAVDRADPRAPAPLPTLRAA